MLLSRASPLLPLISTPPLGEMYGSTAAHCVYFQAAWLPGSAFKGRAEDRRRRRRTTAGEWEEEGGRTVSFL